jgi:hypothetical protein
MWRVSESDDRSADLSAADIRRAGERALSFQRYMFRKSWGVYYAVWAVAFTLYFFLPSFADILGFGGVLASSYVLLGIDLVVSIIAGWMSGRIIEKARNSLLVQQGIRPHAGPYQRHHKWFAAWWLTYILTILLASVYFSSHYLAVVFALATTVTFVFYYALKSSFPDEIPSEGKIAVAFFAAATITSFLVSVLSFNPTIYEVLWIVTIFVWFAAALYSLLHATDELVVRPEPVSQ